ncbi:hypothetical protein GCM10020221_09200 [Streptomyces thioluteus]|uniref:Uncharacterized protein n=1 Tax=Streptomyces thioluteus TaxID=66431 RepID=A0ABP6IZY4_STRTU
MLLGEGDDLVGPGDGVGGAGHQRGTGPLGDVTGRHLVAQVADGLRRRADPGQPGVDDGLRELGVLGEEAVTGVDRVGPGLGRGGKHLGHVEVAGSRSVTAQRIRLIGHPDMHGVPVRVRVDRHACDPGVPARTSNADSDFATIGDEHLAHDGSLLETR